MEHTNQKLPLKCQAHYEATTRECCEGAYTAVRWREVSEGNKESLSACCELSPGVQPVVEAPLHFSAAAPFAGARPRHSPI
jgi:hypothetical protein